jgi:hypothetical protein
MRNAHVGEELILYWPSNFFFTHFGNWCQWGRSFGGFKGNGFILKFGLCLSVLPSMHSIFVNVLHG